MTENLTNIVAIRRTCGRAYILSFGVDDKHEALQAVVRWAQDPDLDFDWSDCCLAVRRIKRLCRNGRDRDRCAGA